MSEYTLWSIATTKDPCCQSNLAQCLALPFPATPLPLLSPLMNARQGTHAPLITLSNPSNYQLREEVCGSIGLWVYCFVLSLLPVSLRKGVRGEGREREREGREGGTVVFQRVLRPLGYCVVEIHTRGQSFNVFCSGIARRTNKERVTREGKGG